MTQRQGASLAPRIPESQGWLVLTAVPDTARGLLGASLVAAGALSIEGDYECELVTDTWDRVTAYVRCSAVVGTVAPSLVTKWMDRTTHNSDVGVDFVANTMQTLTLSSLGGQRKAYLKFTIASGESLTFDRSEFIGQ
jgi:alpha-glucuronidase